MSRTKLIDMIDGYKLQTKAFLLGHQSNVFKYLKYADCFILSSLWEDPGFVLAEASAMNTNIISSDCPNGPKEILDHGNNGYLFKSNSEKDFINKFNEFNKDSSKILNTKILNLKKLTKEFTIFNHFKKLTSYLENEI